MKYITLISILTILFLGCSSPDKPILSEEERIEQLRINNDSIKVVFDSIMAINIKIPQLIDSSFIAPKCLMQFNQLARETNGGLKIVANSKFVAKTIADIIQNQAIDNTDLMIVIDKTSSMSDDLENIKTGLNQILKIIKTKKNIRLSVSTYGDKNIDGKLWYDFQNFETDFDGTMNFIENIKMTHGGDFPESVYDGIYEAFQENFWKSDSKRIVILIGDAPSLDSNLSTHTEKEIIDLAKAERINMNFYPIVISPYYGSYGAINKMQNLTFIESVYPNPNRGLVSVKLNQFGSFKLEIFNQNGELIRSDSLNSDTYSTELYNQPNGLYILRVSDQDKNYDSRKIILNK